MWTYDARKRRYVRVRYSEGRDETRSSSHQHVGGEGVTTDHVFTGPRMKGFWLQSTGAPSMNNNSVTTWKHDLDASNAYPQLEYASCMFGGHGRACGVARNNDGHLNHSGFTMAWVLQPIKMLLPITGLYDHYINGIAQEDVVIVHNELDDSFVMARAENDALQDLQDQFAALTT